MTYKCFVCSAKNGLHGLPIAPEYRKLWLGTIPHVTATDFNQNFRICSLHFDDKYLTRGGRITRNAVPSKFGKYVLENGVWYSIELIDSSTNIDTNEVTNQNKPELDETLLVETGNNENISITYPSTSFITSPPNKTAKQDSGSAHTSSSNGQVSCTFRYVGDIDISMNYTPQTYKRALVKFKEELDKIRHNHKMLHQKYNRMKTKVKDLEQFLDDAEKKGIISTEFIERSNVRKRKLY